ncbi:uncharacterized protein LOC122510306 [Leptopilina heterotoma]|uniref:uncharacterized protein LOC122510306 n=1 Tax=Leptopilina heterotoma TaxID=63436 RepID=UPI001CA9B4EA|nr:uncharacterized protein LOC122510306 [Leptopilina heterotoma]XP_043480778.1 uncharacterized protein LOC122510306 [Leptopilina heterotoma]XP_043480779.1 uncharacterized protein LOC122510306 [Leptopilina heterotoma]
MSSLEEVTNQLMKPVKELADWEYPLSEILGKYYALLENPGEINYGEAAYVVQNSTEVFTKRVDCLGKEVCVLSENFLQHEAEEEKSKLKSKERRSRKTAINFDNFELIDFHKEIGKNINLKPSSQKPVKLLNRRFPQLEIATTQLQNPVDIYDVHGEIIGKKYDFRCNQQLTINGMLVDECTPSDFDTEIVRISDLARSTPTLQIEVSDLSLPDITTQVNESTQEDTGYFSLINSTSNDQSDIQNSLLDNHETSVIERNTTLESIQEISENIQENQTEIAADEQNKSHELSATFSETIEETRNEETANECSTNLQGSNETAVNESAVQEESTIQNESTIQQESSEEVSSTIQENETVTEIEQEKSQETSETLSETLNTTRNEESTIELSEKLKTNKDILETVQENTETNMEVDRTEDLSDEPSHFDDAEMDRDDDEDDVNEEVGNSEKLENGKTRTECSNEKSKLTEENQKELIESNETDSGYRSGESEDFEIPRRRSKRTENMVCVAKDLNENVWKPIPFDQGIPQKLPKSRTKFKLPCHISLLKSKPNSRKRKLPTEEKKRKRNLLGFLTNESPESPLKKLNMYSPSRPFMPLKTEELSDFQKSFEDCFKSRQCYDVFHYEAATTITMDLLGFFPTFTKKDPLLHTTGFKTLAPTPEHISTSGSDAGFSPRPSSPEIVIFDTTNTPPDSPRVSETYEAETFETENFDLDEESPLHSTLNYQKIIESRMKEIHQEFDVRTDLEQNVARWHEMIRPKLEEIERRPQFNIHEYSDLIIKKLEETMEREIPFEQLIVDQSPGEAARYFSAALQLANTYNVDIKTSEKNTDIQLTLLNNDLTRHEISCETPEVSRSKKKKSSKHLA